MDSAEPGGQRRGRPRPVAARCGRCGSTDEHSTRQADPRFHLTSEHTRPRAVRLLPDESRWPRNESYDLARLLGAWPDPSRM